MEPNDYDILIGDYVSIKHQIFIVLDVVDDGYIISPPSRTHQVVKLSPSSYSPYVWILENTIPENMITNWETPDLLEEEFILVTFIENPEEYDDSDLHIIKAEDISIDYVELRDKLVNYVLQYETDELLPFTRYTLSDIGLDLHRRGLYGHNRNLIFKTRTLLGAIITYMDWLDIEKDNIDWSRDSHVWDQQDPLRWSSFLDIEDLVEEFLANYEHLVVELPDVEEIGFLFSRQPQIKASQRLYI